MTTNFEAEDIWGRRRPVPKEIRATLWLRNPNQVSPDVAEMIEKVKDDLVNDPAAKDLWPFIENLDESLEATRYHQRQFLARYRIVEDHYLNTPIRGSTQVHFVMGDAPLKYELEALLVRSRGSLDALAQLVSTSLGQKTQKFGAFLTSVQRGHKAPHFNEMRSAIERNEAWIEADREHRNNIAHDGQVQGFRGMKVGAEGIDAALLLEEDAARYAIQTWPRLLSLTKDLLAILGRARK